jgi:endonuclease YncB( thermonuclease family)
MAAMTPISTDADSDIEKLLKASRMEDCPCIDLDGVSTIGKMVDVYDGDTGNLLLVWQGRIAPKGGVRYDEGGTIHQFRVRLSGYDSPEMRPPKNCEDREAKIAVAHVARDTLWELCTSNSTIRPIDRGVLHDSLLRVQCGRFDKYGRLLVTLYAKLDGSNEVSINQLMIDKSMGYPYFGGKKR